MKKAALVLASLSLLSAVVPARAQDAPPPSDAPAPPAEPAPSAGAVAPPSSPAPGPSAPAPGDTLERSVGEYVQYGLLGMPLVALFADDDPPYAPPVQQGVFLAGWVGAFLAPFGGHVWAPALFYGTPPESTASSRARLFGFISVGLAWASILAWPLLFFPVVGWAAFVAIVVVESIYQSEVAPRMIALAYSDAYAAAPAEQRTPPAQ